MPENTGADEVNLAFAANRFPGLLKPAFALDVVSHKKWFFWLVSAKESFLADAIQYD